MPPRRFFFNLPAQGAPCVQASGGLEGIEATRMTRVCFYACCVGLGEVWCVFPRALPCAGHRVNVEFCEVVYKGWPYLFIVRRVLVLACVHACLRACGRDLIMCLRVERFHALNNHACVRAFMYQHRRADELENARMHTAHGRRGAACGQSRRARSS